MHTERKREREWEWEMRNADGAWWIGQRLGALHRSCVFQLAHRLFIGRFGLLLLSYCECCCYCILCERWPCWLLQVSVRIDMPKIINEIARWLELIWSIRSGASLAQQLPGHLLGCPFNIEINLSLIVWLLKESIWITLEFYSRNSLKFFFLRVFDGFELLAKHCKRC